MVRSVRTLIAIGALAAPLWLPGCGSPVVDPAEPDLVAQGSPVHLTVQADWNDLDAALEPALSAAESAKLEDLEKGHARRSWRIVTIDDQRGTVTATRPPAPTPALRAAPQPITLSARMGPSGDPVREARLLQAMARRLTALAGRDWAPAEERTPSLMERISKFAGLGKNENE